MRRAAGAAVVVLAALVAPAAAYRATPPAVSAPGLGSGAGPGSPGGRPRPPGTGGPAGVRRRRATRLAIAVAWSRIAPPRRITLTVRCQSEATRQPVDGVRIRLQERRLPRRGPWRTIGTAATHGRGVVRFREPVRVGSEVSYRAVFAGTRAYARSVSAVQTVGAVT